MGHKGRAACDMRCFITMLLGLWYYTITRGNLKRKTMLQLTQGHKLSDQRKTKTLPKTHIYTEQSKEKSHYKYKHDTNCTLPTTQKPPDCLPSISRTNLAIYNLHTHKHRSQQQLHTPQPKWEKKYYKNPPASQLIDRSKTPPNTSKQYKSTTQRSANTKEARISYKTQQQIRTNKKKLETQQRCYCPNTQTS
jgi:hypothetical protein